MKNSFVGTWTYRSFLRDPDLSLPFEKLKFGAGILNLVDTGSEHIKGSLGDVGWSLDLIGSCTFGTPYRIQFQGKGIISNELWVYDYIGYLAEPWPNGLNERPSIVGTIVRTVEHSNGQSEAGLVASWIAVKQ